MDFGDEYRINLARDRVQLRGWSAVKTGMNFRSRISWPDKLLSSVATNPSLKPSDKRQKRRKLQCLRYFPSTQNFNALPPLVRMKWKNKISFNYFEVPEARNSQRLMNIPVHKVERISVKEAKCTRGASRPRLKNTRKCSAACLNV
jgi:hypothetical protein